MITLIKQAIYHINGFVIYSSIIRFCLYYKTLQYRIGIISCQYFAINQIKNITEKGLDYSYYLQTNRHSYGSLWHPVDESNTYHKVRGFTFSPLNQRGMVSVAGFEPALSWSQATRFAKLSYTLRMAASERIELSSLTQKVKVLSIELRGCGARPGSRTLFLWLMKPRQIPTFRLEYGAS